MSNYLRNRPFMIISYTYVLAAGQKPNTKGFGAEAQWEPIENMIIVDRVSSKQEIAAELIIDLFENKVIKCRDNTLDHDHLINVFVSRHYEDVKSALATWITKDPSNLGKVQAFVERFKTKTPVTIEALEEGLNGIARSFMFEQNTPETRAAVTEKMVDHLGQQGLKDFSVQCDDVNNTEERVNAHELWADVAVVLEGESEFKYIAIRVTKQVANV